MYPRWSIVLTAAVAFLSLVGGTAHAQIPANDSCAGAVTISSLPFNYSQDTRLATGDPTDPVLPCADSGGGKTVWFVYTADSTRYLNFSTEYSTPADYDIALGLFTGACGSLVQVRCVDDIVPGTVRQAILGYEVQAGVTYYLHVAEWNGGGPNGGVPTGGDLVLDVYQSEPPPLYADPKSGAIAGGDSVEMSLLLGKNIPSIINQVTFIPGENPTVQLLPTPDDVRPPSAPEGSNYIEDPSLTGSNPPPLSQPVVLKNFQGNTETGAIPPDPILAVGPDHVIGLVNSSFIVWDKDGNLLSAGSLNTWFSNVASPIGFSDPQILYDHYEDRWIMAGGDFASPYHFLVSISDDSDPFGTWYSWALPSGLGDSLTGALPDYPQLGYDSLAYYFTTREFNPGFVYSRLRIVEKTQLLNNDAGPVSWTDFWDLRDPDAPGVAPDGLRPSILYGTPGVHYLLNTSPYGTGTYFTLWTVHDPIGSPTLSAVNIPVTQYSSPGNAGQLDGGTAIESGGSAVRHKPVYRDSSLWAVHSIASGTGNLYSSIRYLRFNPHTGVALEDVAMGLEGYWHYYPALMVDSGRNVIITYTRSGLTEYPGAYVSGHRDSDPPGLSPSIPLAEGGGNYDVVGGGRNRWGDYMGIGLDPSDPEAVWVNTEYAPSTNTWQTRIAMVKMGPLPGAYIYTDRTSMDLGIYEVTDTSDLFPFIITNNGLDSLVISSIDLPDSHFFLEDPPAFPFALQTFEAETVYVFLAPQDRGSFDDSLVINSNDTVRPSVKIALSGDGFIIDTAASGTMYAGSGTTDLGRLLTTDPLDAATAPVGQSGYTQLINIRVNPVSGEIIGLATTSPTSAATYDLVRVNSSLGDAHPVSSIPLSLMKGLSIHNDTVYAARITGQIYRVDVPTGTPELVVATGINISGMDFNPVTGELWASVRGGIPIDAIFRIDLTTGLPSYVGSTGLGVQTVDIAFDANGNLFGLIGTGTTENQLILIDTLSGGGTIIGPMGIASGQCIAFHPDAATFAQSFHLREKWNLLAPPVILEDQTLHGIIPPALTQSQAFNYDGGYFIQDTLRNREGFWVKIAGTSSHSIIGEPDSTDTISVRSKWNMIGTNSFIAPTAGITSTPPGIVITGYYSYEDTGYQIASSLVPGKGYWVKTGAAGTLKLNVPSLAPAVAAKNPVTEFLEGKNMLTVRDAQGRSQKLYFGPQGEQDPDPALFELPPVPPEGAFDARFASGRLVEIHQAVPVDPETYPVRISSGRPPIVVTWTIDRNDGVEYFLEAGEDGGSGTTRYRIEGTGYRTFDGAAAATLRLVVGASGVPTEFALKQNYPNPFNPVTTISYDLPMSEHVNLVLFNTLGERVETLVDGVQEAGAYTIRFSAGDLATGVYFYRITAGSFVSVRKMMVLR